jgi:hypothetical protein
MAGKNPKRMAAYFTQRLDSDKSIAVVITTNPTPHIPAV